MAPILGKFLGDFYPLSNKDSVFQGPVRDLGAELEKLSRDFPDLPSLQSPNPVL